MAELGLSSLHNDSYTKNLEDTVAEALVVPEEIRGQIPADFGRAKGIAWYYLGGFALVQTQAQQARIVKWDSQG